MVERMCEGEGVDVEEDDDGRKMRGRADEGRARSDRVC